MDETLGRAVLAARSGFRGLFTGASGGCGMYTITLGGRGYDGPRGGTHRRPFPLDVPQGALPSRMEELAAADLFGDPSAGKVAAAEAKVAVVERRLTAAVERFEADPENRTWGDKVDEYDRQKRKAVAARVADEVRVPVMKRGQSRLCAAMVYFAGGGRSAAT